MWWWDVTNPETGEWLTWEQMRQRRGTKLGGEVDKAEYMRVVSELEREENAAAAQRRRCRVQLQGDRDALIEIIKVKEESLS